MFELKLVIEAPGLETAIKDLAAAIATGAGPARIAIGDGIVKHAVETAIEAVNPNTDDSSDDDLPGAIIPDMTGQLDKWGLPWDARIHANAAEKIAKGTGQWKKRKGVEETFFQRTQTELIAAAHAAGVYTGPENLIPKPAGYVAPVLTPEQAGIAPVAPVVPAPPATTTPVVPAPPAATVATPVVYTHDVLQSAVMKMFSNPDIGAKAGEIAPRLLALYGVAAIHDTPADKLESFVKLVEAIESSPTDSMSTLSAAEVKKSMGVTF